MKMKIALFIVLLSLKGALCGNILFVSPLSSPSHHIWNKVLSMGLTEKGYNVTMLSHDSEKEPTPNFTVITMEGFYEVLRKMFKMSDFAEMSTVMTIKGMYDYAELVCKHDMNTKGLQTLLSYPKDFKFDLIVFDVTIAQCFYPLIERFNNPPVVAVTAFLLPPTVSYAFGNHLHTSHIPFYSSEFTTKMNTAERVLNFIYTYGEVLYRNYIASPKEYELAKKMFGENIRPLEEVERNISLLLANIDPVLNYPIALPPNIIPVGGLHIRPAQALSGDLKEILDNTKHGVILFSLGTNIQFADLRVEQRQALVNAFGKVPQTILWKCELDTLEGLPENVVIRKWLPQNDILGHPNTKLFISHGGALSTQEAMYHGVPVIGIPFFADQYVNIHHMKERGIAEHLDITQNFTADKVYETIKACLSSAKYRKKIRKISKLYHDQPQTALDKGIFWIEHVLRHGSAEHLVLAARDMPGYQTANLDVLGVFVFGVVLLYLLLILILTGCRLVITLPHATVKPRTSR